uniref:Apple domain-containing protein n=2 Tax=Tetranychus urticae TaxID=32264 RepID=T1KW34_TETUR
MYSKSTTIGRSRLNITNYYIKAPFESLKDSIAPRVTIFTGIDPSEPDYSKQTTLTLDTYIQTESSEADLHVNGFVKPEPGIGCPFYFSPTTRKPQLFSQAFSRLHYIVDTTVKKANSKSKKTVKREEVYIDQLTQQMYIETTIEGEKTEEIYDFTLGIKYEDQYLNSCPIKQLDLSIPGMIVYSDQGAININAHLGFNLSYKFLGIVQNSLSSGRDLYVWEAVEYNKTFEDQKCDKLVTTQYLLLTNYGNHGEQFILHSTTINGYTKTGNNYIKVLETSRVYRKFEPTIQSEDYDLKFNVDKCYPFESQHRTIKLHFRCQDDCDHFKSQIYEHRYAIKSMITRTDQISSSRISNIEVIPDSNGATAYITFLEAPEIKEAFHSDNRFLKTERLIPGSSTFIAQRQEECLEVAAKSATNFQTVIYCYKQKHCFAFNEQKDLTENEDGDWCDIYQIPLKNLHRYSQELPLDKIDWSIEWKKLIYSLTDASKKALYSCDLMENVASKAQRHFDSYYLYDDHTRLIPNDENILKIDGVKNVGECFHECQQTEKFDCRSISICPDVDQPECIISNVSRRALTDDDSITNRSCKVLYINPMLYYVKVANRKYKNPVTVSELDFYAENCANLCYETDDCLSFQDCNRDCTFGGYYTDSSTEFSQDCDIYIPKVLHKFTDNGKRIVSDVFHTELGLNSDQCAALCHDWDNGDEVCQSFNFCPSTKTTSLCELSKYKIEDSTTKTIDSKICHNYGYISSGVTKSQNSKDDGHEGLSGKTVISLIAVFVGIGFVAGFILPFVYAKFISTQHSRLNTK